MFIERMTWVCVRPLRGRIFGGDAFISTDISPLRGELICVILFNHFRIVKRELPKPLIKIFKTF